MKKIIIPLLFFLLSTALISCTNFTPEPMNLDIENPEGQLDFCKDDPTKCLENTAPTFCEKYYGTPCCMQGLSDDARCNEAPPSLTGLVEICSKDSKSPWCPTYEMCKSAETPSNPSYTVCKFMVPYPIVSPGCSTKYNVISPVTKKNHQGLDVTSNRQPLPIVASWPGKVVTKRSDSVSGNVTIVEYKYDDIPISQRPANLKSGESMYVYYGHQTDEGFKLKNVGDTLQAGEQFGQVGKTGTATGYHIHMEVKFAPSGKTESGWSGYGTNRQNPEVIFPGVCG